LAKLTQEYGRVQGSIEDPHIDMVFKEDGDCQLFQSGIEYLSVLDKESLHVCKQLVMFFIW